MKSWNKISEKVVYSKYRKILSRTFATPTGKESDFEVVKEGRVVCVLPLTADNHVILAKQFRPGPEKPLLELPGGGVNEGEDPARAAVRELMEETGYEGEIELVGTSFHSAYSSMVRYNFVAKNCKKVAEPNNDSEDEITEPVLMALEDFKEHLRSGELTDMGTGYRCLDYLGLLK